ncbi:DUF3800 domain-containing protein [Prauserella flavalba]|uniref:DUF3800 domain-containing protein n=1 Tax=Prauserella flavalba TaxID=1477506 RepID=UPI0036E543C5
MARRYLFSDESGDLQFKRQDSSRYFAVGTLLIEEDELARMRHTLAHVRDELAWRNHGLDSTFHACTDGYEVREAVFNALSNLDFRVDVTLLDKPKAEPQTRSDEPTFFQYAWFYHLKFLAPKVLRPGDELLVVAASMGTKKTRKAFRSAIEDVLSQCISFRVKHTFAFWRDESDFALQAVDYCTWAVTRRWERGDSSYLDIVRRKVKTQYDLWSWGTKTYY